MRHILLASLALPLLMSPAFSQAVAPSPSSPSPTSPTIPPSIMAPAMTPRADTTAPITTQPAMPSATTITPSSPTATTTQPTMPTMPTATTITPSSPTTVTTLPAGGTPGANSFTEGQARSRLEANGYSSVSALTKDADGIWRGTATKGSRSGAVSVDYKGVISGG